MYTEAYTTYVTSKENGLIEGGNLGSFYRYVNSKLVHKTDGIGVLIDDGSYIYDDQTKAKILNDFYASVFITDNNVYLILTVGLMMIVVYAMYFFLLTVFSVF